MLLTRVRVSPCRDLLIRSSSGRLTSRTPSSPFSTMMGAATVWLRVPLGPLTVTTGPSIATSTPEGTGTGSLPMRDMVSSPPGLSSPDVGEDFPTHALLVGLAVGEQPLAGRDDRDAETAEHLGQARALGVDAQTGLADPADAGQRALTVAAILEGDRQRLADLALLGVLDLEGGDVALLLQDLRNALFDLAVGHRHGVVERLVGVAQTRQHVCDRVGHRHVFGFLLAWFRPADLWGTCDVLSAVLVGFGGLPAGLGHAGQLAAVGHLAQADPAQAELAVDGLGTATALAARVATHRELGLAGRL